MGKINQIARCDWLPEWARWCYLARSGLPAVSREKNFPESQIIIPLLGKLFRSRWLDISLGLFCEFMDLDSVWVHKHAKTRTWPTSSHLHAWSITHISCLWGLVTVTLHVLVDQMCLLFDVVGYFPHPRCWDTNRPWRNTVNVHHQTV